MGTRIEAAATSHHLGHIRGRGALHLTDEAARACLERGHHRADELDLLINAGLYKDGNAAEPALASIIQENIGANPGSPPKIGRHGTFSFDLLNAGCGVVTAAQMIDAFIGHGTGQLGMVVAADVDPTPHTSRGFPFTPAGGALLVSHVDGDSGFQRFEVRTFPEHADMFESHLRWDPSAGIAHVGRNVLEFHEHPEFFARAVDLAVEVTGSFLSRAGLTPDDVDLLIGSQYPRGFDTAVARGLGIPLERLPHVPRELDGAHTAGPIAALEAAIESRQFARATHTLFVTAGAGITIAVALYRRGHTD